MFRNYSSIGNKGYGCHAPLALCFGSRRRSTFLPVWTLMNLQLGFERPRHSGSTGSEKT
jgi:hypothetical protein